MPRPYKRQPGHDNPAKAYELRQSGKMPAEIGRILGLSARTVSTYISRFWLGGHAKRPVKHTKRGGKCPWCALSAPCTCTGPWRVEDFARSGEAAC